MPNVENIRLGAVIGFCNLDVIKVCFWKAENILHFRCGPLIDLCRGPHVRHTGKIKALKIHKVSVFHFSFYYVKYTSLFIVDEHRGFMYSCLFSEYVEVSTFVRLIQHFTSLFLYFLMCQNSSTYWEGKADMETLQRIYGISFPDPKMLKEWEKFQEEAKNRDHRKLGRVRV